MKQLFIGATSNAEDWKESIAEEGDNFALLKTCKALEKRNNDFRNLIPNNLMWYKTLCELEKLVKDPDKYAKQFDAAYTVFIYEKAPNPIQVDPTFRL